MKCKKDENIKRCPCTYISRRTHRNCDKKGICCECLKHHLSAKELPACCFPIEAEKTFDRSFTAFVKAWKL